MVKLELDTVYTADIARHGEGSRGRWQMIIVKDEKPRSRFAITIFTNKTIDINDGGQFKIIKVTKMTYGAKKNKKGEWEDSVSIEADCEAIKSDADFGSDFTEIAGEDLPWEGGADDFDQLPMPDLLP